MHYDVAVAGLGAMGSAALYQSAKAGMRVVGIDRFDPPHDRGSSHGDTRISRQSIGEGEAYVPFVTEAHAIWRELERETDETLFTQCGALIVAANGGRVSHHGSTDFFETTRRSAERFSIPHEMLDAATLRARFPHLIGLRGDERAYYEPGGGLVHPEACIRAQLTRAEALDATIYRNTPVDGFEDLGRQGVALETESGRITADRLILATGAWLPDVIGGSFSDLLTVTRQTLHWLELDQPDRIPEGSPVTIWMHGASETDYFYAFPPQPGEKAMKFATEQYSNTTRAESLNRHVAPEETRWLYETHVRDRVAGVSNRPMKSAACLYTTTPDRGFIIDRLATSESVLIVSACSGHGFKHSAGIGAALVDAMTKSDRFDLAPFALQRFDGSRQPLHRA